MKKFIRLLSFLVILSILTSALPVYATGSVDATSEMPYTDASGIFNGAYTSTVTAYDQTGAAAAGVPAGYSGYVLRVQPKADGGYAGCELDFSSQNIQVDNIESITFRVFLPAGHREMRLLGEKAPTTWVMRLACTMGAWCDITLDADGTNFQSGMSLSSLANSAGNLGRMCLIGRMGSGSDASFYLDSVRITYKGGASDDTTPPVITYNGPTEISALEGEKLTLDGLSAYDEYDKMDAEITYEWSAGALDGASGLKAGTHVCTVKATDRSGNVAALDIVVTVNADPSLIRIENIPHIPHDINISGNAVYEGAVSELSSVEAEAKGVPAGYKGSVYEISAKAGTSYVGVCLDFSEYGIPISLVESISFNVLVPTGYSELRMRNGNTDDWVMRCSSAPTGSWCDVTLTASGLNFFGASKMQTLANAEGNLGSLCLIGRVSGNYAPYYIDSIVIRLKTDDKTAPVISHSGKTDILTSSGKIFTPGITAYDEAEGRDIPLVYEWSAGALDTEGRMLEGEHTCRVSATDYYGNTSYLELNVTVGPPDVEAPNITFLASEIYVPVGTFYRMVLVAEDNYDDVEVVEEWSEGAIDFGGRLNEGVHTLTLTATDLSGNSTVKVVTVHVISGDTTVGQLIVQGQ